MRDLVQRSRWSGVFHGLCRRRQFTRLRWCGRHRARLGRNRPRRRGRKAKRSPRGRGRRDARRRRGCGRRRESRRRRRRGQTRSHPPRPARDVPDQEHPGVPRQVFKA